MAELMKGHQLHCDLDVGSKLNQSRHLCGIPVGIRKTIAQHALRLQDHRHLHGKSVLESCEPRQLNKHWFWRSAVKW